MWKPRSRSSSNPTPDRWPASEPDLTEQFACETNNGRLRAPVVRLGTPCCGSTSPSAANAATSRFDEPDDVARTHPTLLQSRCKPAAYRRCADERARAAGTLLSLRERVGWRTGGWPLAHPLRDSARGAPQAGVSRALDAGWQPGIDAIRPCHAATLVVPAGAAGPGLCRRRPHAADRPAQPRSPLHIPAGRLPVSCCARCVRGVGGGAVRRNCWICCCRRLCLR